MKLKTFESVTLYRFRYHIGYGLIIGLGLFLMLFRLGSLTPALAQPEVDAVGTSHLKAIAHNPVNAPYRLVQAASTKILQHGYWSVRLPSVFFATLTIFGIYFFLKYTYTERVGVIGAILSVFSSTLLVFSRLGTPAVAMAASLSLLLGFSAWLTTADKLRAKHLLFMLAAVILALYTPLGWVWLVVLIVLHPKELTGMLKSCSKPWLAVVVLLMLAGLAPIVWTIVRDPHLLKSWLLLPDNLPRLRTIAWNVVRVPAAFFWRDTFSDPVTHLGNLPLLDIFTTAMVTLGGLTLIFKPTLARTRILLIVGLVGLAINAINPNPLNVALLLPVTGVLAAIGLERMLEEWYNTFPKNPFARVGALVPLALIFSMTMFYHIHRSFVAWPKNPDTKAYYQKHLPE